VHFDFLDPPSPEALMRAIETLINLSCLDAETGNITESGEAVTRFPLHPQLARMLIESPKHRCSNEALSIASMLATTSVFVRPDKSMKTATEARSRFAHLDGDHLTLLNVFHAYKQNVQDGVGPARFCTENCLNTRGMMSAETIRERLKKTMEELGLQLVSTDFKDKEYYPNIRRCLLSGFFTQVAHLEKKDEKTGQYFTMKDRQEVSLHHTTSLQHKPEWVVYHEYVMTSRGYLKTVTQIRGEWLLDIAPHYYDPAKLPECEARGLLEKMQARRAGVGVAGVGVTTV
jgi:pre-mRNA-splicing factor ATP-dependent RNA helicase DHX15/PRP43